MSVGRIIDDSRVVLLFCDRDERASPVQLGDLHTAEGTRYAPPRVYRRDLGSTEAVAVEFL